MPRLRAQQGVHGRVIPYEVAVLFSFRIEPRMEITRCLRCRQNANVLRQVRINRQRQLGNRHSKLVLRNFNMRDHAKRVHTSIGAARTMNALDRREHLSEGFFDQLLNTRPDLLDLPALVIRTVVSDQQLEFEIP